VDFPHEAYPCQVGLQQQHMGMHAPQQLRRQALTHDIRALQLDYMGRVLAALEQVRGQRLMACLAAAGAAGAARRVEVCWPAELQRQRQATHITCFVLTAGHDVPAVVKCPAGEPHWYRQDAVPAVCDARLEASQSAEGEDAQQGLGFQAVVEPIVCSDMQQLGRMCMRHPLPCSNLLCLGIPCALHAPWRPCRPT
jgi:hypothetical protein